MNRTLWVLILLFYISCFIFSEPVCNNRYPIVLVGGFMTFGRDEALGFRYWGGLMDIQRYLEENGFQVYTADIGPLSSNWDRACELYAEISGGMIDYGAAHAESFSHARFGRTSEGFYPEWGTIDQETGEIRKVHLICHSMGGQTGRVLAHLLENGNARETAFSGNDSSSLFSGGHEWIASITTISAPHDGTTLTEAVPLMEDFIMYLLALLERANSLTGETFFDFQLDQWGFRRMPEESIDEFISRFRRSQLWNRTEDFSLYDLTPRGASGLNAAIPACRDVYYFSWATEETGAVSREGRVMPELGMNPGLLPSALFIGDSAGISPAWRMNDGIVNTASMPGPRNGSTDEIVSFNGVPLRGVWNYMGVIPSCDHFDVIGITSPPLYVPIEGYASVQEWYLDLCRFLWSLQ